MSNVGIFREAKIGQISSLNHLLNTQEFRNQSPKFNKNVNNDNKCVVYYKNTDTFKTLVFKRNSQNENAMKVLKKKEDNLDALARADYKKYKTQQKKDNPDKKIRTVLQSKNLKKEFGIFVGGDKVINDKEDFEKRALNTAIKILEKKGLGKENLLSLTIHYDEKTPHIHCQYNDYSFEHKTTGTEHQKIRFVEGKDKKEIRKINRDKFAEFQDLVAEGMGMERGQRGSKAKNIDKSQHYENEAKKFEELQKQNNLLHESYEKLQEDFNNLSQNFEDNIYKNDSKKIRLDLGYFGLNKALKNTAQHFGIDYSNFLKIFDKNYSSDNVFTKLLDKAKIENDKVPAPKSPHIKNKDLSLNL